MKKLRMSAEISQTNHPKFPQKYIFNFWEGHRNRKSVPCGNGNHPRPAPTLLKGFDGCVQSFQ